MSRREVLTLSSANSSSTRDLSRQWARGPGVVRSSSPKKRRPASSKRWQDDAACQGQGHFFYVPDYPLTDAAKARITRAKAVCAGCPVSQQCRSFAHRNKMSGVWGGVLIAPFEHRGGGRES